MYGDVWLELKSPPHNTTTEMLERQQEGEAKSGQKRILAGSPTRILNYLEIPEERLEPNSCPQMNHVHLLLRGC